jgi:hypothetical protein
MMVMLDHNITKHATRNFELEPNGWNEYLDFDLFKLLD